MLKQNKFISIISIGGTALAIMMIMVIFVTDEVKNISISPEDNRDHTLYLRWERLKGADSPYDYGGLINYWAVKNYIYNLKTPQVVSAIISDKGTPPVLISNPDKLERTYTGIKRVDAAFWEIMSFDFSSGKPFTTADFDAGLKKAVISEDMAKNLYGNVDAVGKTIEIDFVPYSIAGVVKNVSPVFEYAYSGVYIPYTSDPEFLQNLSNITSWGVFNVLLLAQDKKDFTAIEEEVRSLERKFNAENPKYILSFPGPYDHRSQLMSSDARQDLNQSKAITRVGLILLLLLLIPSVNLLGFSISRMKKRIEEIGVRKAFGAKNNTIMIQILYENFITSLIGGIIGLVLSIMVVYWLKDWLLGVGEENTIPIFVVVSPVILAIVFIVTFLLNVLSAGLPAYKASKMKVVDSLNRKNEL